MVAVASSVAYVASVSSPPASSSSSGLTFWQANGPLLTASLGLLGVGALALLTARRGRRGNGGLSQIKQSGLTSILIEHASQSISIHFSPGLSDISQVNRAALDSRLDSLGDGVKGVVDRLGPGDGPFTW